MKHIKLLALVAALVPCLSQGAVNAIAKNYGTQALAPTSNPIVFSGALAPAGAGNIQVGYFGVADSAITAAEGNVANWALVAASFQQFGATSTMGTGSGAAPGTNGLFQVTPGAQTAGTPFSGKNVYVAIGNGATLLASTHVVVFKSTTTFADEPTPSVNAWLTDVAVGEPPAGQFLLGNLEQTGQVYYTTGPLANLAITGVIGAVIIPEPATALFGLLSLGFGVIRRRR